MRKALDLAKKIFKSLDSDWSEALLDNNLHLTFGSIYSMNDLDIEDKNRIICYIIYAFSPDSQWLDLKKDRIDNKKKILDSLGANTSTAIFKKILYNNDDIVGMCTFNYLEELKTWKWPIVFTLLDYSAKMQRLAAEETESERSWSELDKEGIKQTLREELDIADILKASKEKGALLQLAIDKRMQADEMMEEIKKDHVATDIATQSDFSFQFSDTAKKRDILSWRQFIDERNKKLKKVI